MNIHKGKERIRIKELIRQLNYQEIKWGECELRKARIIDLEACLKEKVK